MSTAKTLSAVYIIIFLLHSFLYLITDISTSYVINALRAQKFEAIYFAAPGLHQPLRV